MIAFLKEQFLALTILAAAAGAFAGYFVRRILTDRRLSDAGAQAKKILEDAEREANNRHKEAEIYAKDELHKSRAEFDRETKSRRKELADLETRMGQKEENIER